MCQAGSGQSASPSAHSCWKCRYWVPTALVVSRGDPARLQGALSISLRTPNPITVKFQHNYCCKSKNYLFSKPLHLDLTSVLWLVFNITIETSCHATYGKRTVTKQRRCTHYSCMNTVSKCAVYAQVT